jgi:shikimate kinase
MNIVLIGYRCTGKTTVGKILAHDMKRDFVDTDRLIEEKTRLPIPLYVSQKGWNPFRELEKELIRELVTRDNLVIGTGGGVVMDPENVNNLKRKGWMVWLKADSSVIRERMRHQEGQRETRPSLSGADPLEEIDRILDERTQFYARAKDFEVETNGQSPVAVVNAIIKALPEYLKKIG